MHIGNKMRVGALITLAFFLMMLTSLFTVGLANPKPKSEAKKTEISKKEKPSKKNEHDEHDSEKKKPKTDKKKAQITPRKKPDNPDLVESQMAAYLDTNVIANEKHTKEVHHTATWYDLHGSKTTSGQRMHRDSATAAYNFAPLGTHLLVTNMHNNKSCVVKVTDRMGNKKKQHIDLSKAAFGFISDHGVGKIKVTIKHL
jgi:rare lipoprotein A (peptidoglycan hydrolase)